MNTEEIEAQYLTLEEVSEYLEVSKDRVHKIVAAGLVERMKGGIYNRSSVEAYKLKRGDKKGGRYPKGL